MNSSSWVSRLPAFALVLVAAGVISILLALVPSNSASARPANAAAAGIDAKAQFLAKLDDDWSAAAATKNAERVASFYAADALAYPPGEPVAVGREAAKEVWAAMFADPSLNISWKTTHARISSSGEFGFTAGTYLCTYGSPDGKNVIEKGKYLCTWEKQSDGSWKATHDMWNADSR